MNYFKKTLAALLVAAFVFVPVAHAQTYTYTTNTHASLQAQLQILILQVLQLQEQLRVRGVHTPTYTGNCFTSYYYRDGRCHFDRYDDDADDIDEIEVSYVGRIAQVRVEYDDGDVERFAFHAGTDREVAVLLSRELGISAATLEDIIDSVDRRRHNDDIDEIDVQFFGDDADVTVYFEDGDRDRFTLRNVDEDEDEVIEYLADRYNMDEDDIEDVIDFRNNRYSDRIRDIDVEFDNDDAFITIRFRNGARTYITLRNVDEDEDEVIEYLADRYNMDEDDIEDVIDFDYN